jgi:acyl carrier protein
MDEGFIKVIAASLKTDSANIRESSTVETIPEWDSLSHWTVITRLEEAYNIEFTMEEATEFKNLEDIYNVLMKKVSGCQGEEQ